MNREELKYYGLYSCLELWKKRPDDIIRIYSTEKNLRILAPLLKWCAKQKKAYHIVPEEDLYRLTNSVHHEGVCLVAKDLQNLTSKEFFKRLLHIKKNSPLLYLDGVENPHNVGSILRTAAHFGVPFLLGEKGKFPSISPSTYRVAKGGAEHVRLVNLENPVKALTSLQKSGFILISTSSHHADSLYQFCLPAKSIFLLGSESRGVSKEVQKLSSHHIHIPGTGVVESLNVAVAASLLLGEYSRQHYNSGIVS